MLRYVCSEMTSKGGKNKEVAHEPQASVSLMFLPHFDDLICDLLLNRPTAAWNLFVLYNDQKRSERSLQQYLPDAGKGSTVCSSLHCGTRYLIAVLAHPDCSGAPLGGERFRGARFDSWAILAYWCTLLQALLGRAIALRLC